MRAIFDLEGEGTGLFAHYRASSFDAVSKVWSDVSGKSRDGQALSLAAPARELSRSFDYWYQQSTAFVLTADVDAWFSLSIRRGANPYGSFDLQVGDTTYESLVLQESQAVDEGEGCFLYSVMTSFKLPRASYSTGSLLVRIPVTNSFGINGPSCDNSDRIAYAKVLQYTAGESSTSVVTTSGHGAASSVAAVTGCLNPKPETLNSEPETLKYEP